jgi:hypothetical protein
MTEGGSLATSAGRLRVTELAEGSEIPAFAGMTGSGDGLSGVSDEDLAALGVQGVLR